tara:strand:- start:51 stop:722 length:672 start_codon:yes stop_codon:yes gene_type:complete
MLLYQADHHGALPVEGDYKGKIPGVGDPADFAWWHQVGHEINDKAWYNVLPPYAGESPLRDLLPGATNEARRRYIRDFTSSLFHAPGAEIRDTESAGAKDLIGNKVPTGYFINSQLYNKDAAAALGISSSRLREQGLRYASLPDPAKVVFMAEARTSDDEKVPGENESAADVFRARGQAAHVGSRYGGRTSLVFFDGSVRTYDALEVKQASHQLGIIWTPWVP